MKFTKEHCNAIKESWKNRIDYRGPSYCKICGAKNKRSGNICCSRKCAAKAKEKPRGLEYKKRLNEWENRGRKFKENFYKKVAECNSYTECKLKIDRIKKFHWIDLVFKKKLIEILKEKCKKIEERTFKNRSLGQKRAWAKLNYEKRIKRTTPGNIVRTERAQSINVSSIELMEREILDSLQINYVTQKWIGRWCVDIYIPNGKLIIECNGDYWHSLPERKQRDLELKLWCEKYGYKIIFIQENEIRNNAKKALMDALDECDMGVMLCDKN